MQSVMTPQQRFAQIESPKIQRSVFDRSHGYKTTLDAGYLVPVFVEEALPGDTFNVKATMFGRMATLLKPIMDNVFIDLHFFSVPYRLVWDNWQKFNGEQTDPGDSTSFLVPTCPSTATTGYSNGSIFDYFGLPTKVATSYDHSALPLRAYNLIYNEWYRDENLQDSVLVSTDDGPDAPADFTLLRRGRRKDYFTSCLPWAQKADAVSIPLGTTAPVMGIGTYNPNATPTSLNPVYDSTSASSTSFTGWLVEGSGSPVGNAETFLAIKQGSGNKPEILVDLSEATAATINSLREAFQVQRMYERDARGGTRYTELIRSHFGVISPDQRLQRPEFLAGSSAPINVSPIAQNSATGATGTPQGNLSAMGTFQINGSGFVKSFTEHEIVIGIVSIRADQNYQQGLDRMWSRSTRFDFYWPTLAHLGEQAVLKKEIYCDGSATDDDVFGYQERYAEYRYKPSRITGKYRSNDAASLDTWHLAMDYASVPSLNAAFIVENPPIDRVVAVNTEPQFLLDCYFNFRAARPMPTYATPGLIDHF